MIARLAAALSAALLLFAAVDARAQGAAEPFLGLWDGGVVAGSGPLRAASFLVEEAPDGGLSLSWRNYEAGQDAIQERDRSLRLEPAGASGVYAATLPEPGAEASGYIVGNTMTVTITAPTEDGGQERQIYRREVAGEDLTLHYTRLVDGAVRRELTGTFVRTIE